ncbi:MAG: DUF1080 domain-containing protein [Bacteroidales bacterium]|nr:DUF1080 domain-containing protein [Bacteroidales bacterium]
MSEFWDPQPEVVVPGKSSISAPVPAPSDAEILFDGKDLSQWESANGGEAQWPVVNGILTVDKKLGNIRTKKSYGDFQLHIEWKEPENIAGDGQSRGNSGIFLQGVYEIQVLDSYNNPTYNAGFAGSIYKQFPPLVNVTNPPGEWNIFDIIYTAPTFTKNGKYRTSPAVTIIHNGVVIQNHTILLGATVNVGFPRIKKHGNGPVVLQAHRDKTETNVSYRNIWIREL